MASDELTRAEFFQMFGVAITVAIAIVGGYFGWQQMVLWPKFSKAVEFKLRFVERQLSELYGPVYGTMQRSGAIYFAGLRHVGVRPELMSLLGFDQTRNLQLAERPLFVDPFAVLGAYPRDEKQQFIFLQHEQNLVALNADIRSAIISKQDLVSPSQVDRPPSFSRFLRHEAELSLFLSTRRPAGAHDAASSSLTLAEFGSDSRKGRTQFPADMFEHVRRKHELLLRLQNKYRMLLEYKPIRFFRPAIRRALGRLVPMAPAVVVVLLGLFCASAILAIKTSAIGAAFSACLFAVLAVPYAQVLLRASLLRSVMRKAEISGKQPGTPSSIAFSIRGLWSEGRLAGRLQIVYSSIESMRRDLVQVRALLAALIHARGDDKDLVRELRDINYLIRLIENAMKSAYRKYPQSNPRDPGQWGETLKQLMPAFRHAESVVRRTERLVERLLPEAPLPTISLADEETPEGTASLYEDYWKIYATFKIVLLRAQQNQMWFFRLLGLGHRRRIDLFPDRDSDGSRKRQDRGIAALEKGTSPLRVWLAGGDRAILNSIGRLLCHPESAELAHQLLEELGSRRAIAPTQRLGIMDQHCKIAKRALRDVIQVSRYPSRPVRISLEHLDRISDLLSART